MLFNQKIADVNELIASLFSFGEVIHLATCTPHLTMLSFDRSELKRHTHTQRLHNKPPRRNEDLLWAVSGGVLLHLNTRVTVSTACAVETTIWFTDVESDFFTRVFLCWYHYFFGLQISAHYLLHEPAEMNGADVVTPTDHFVEEALAGWGSGSWTKSGQVLSHGIFFEHFSNPESLCLLQ